VLTPLACDSFTSSLFGLLVVLLQKAKPPVPTKTPSEVMDIDLVSMVFPNRKEL
jgi:hypothetical protein